MLKRLPPLKFRLMLLMLVNPLLALKAGNWSIDVMETSSHLVQYGHELFHNVTQFLYGSSRLVTVR